MSNLGMGVMIGVLGGNEDFNEESVKAFTSCLNKTITALTLGEDDALHFVMDDGTKMRLHDDGQSCCEHRYMKTDDKLADFVGAQLLGAEIKDAPSLPCDGDSHDVQFLDVKTSKGVFQMCSHNEHNGYYGGFLIRSALE